MLVSVCVGSVRGNTLPQLIASIVAQEFSNWELVIAVQGRDPALLSSVEQQSQRDPRITHIGLERFGKSYALNEAVKVAKGDILAFTDDDCGAASDWLTTIVSCFTQEPAVGIVAGDLIAAPGRRLSFSTCPATYTIECVYRPAAENYVAPPGFYWAGANFAVRREVMDKVGPFDEYLGPGTEFPAAEDVDFALRAEVLGVVMWTTPKSVIYHAFGRRYGFKNALKLHRGYAIGSGALGGKLALWGHKLSKVWGRKPRTDEFITGFVTRFPRSLLEVYESRYYKIGKSRYLSRFEIDSRILSRPKSTG